MMECIHNKLIGSLSSRGQINLFSDQGVNYKIESSNKYDVHLAMHTIPQLEHFKTKGVG